MTIEEIKEFKFSYTPYDDKFPIRAVDVYIRAKTRKEAELIALGNHYKFFDQDLIVRVSEFSGYIKLD